jgi:hypothetical protein
VVKWIAVGKVLTRKSFSEESLKRTMFAAWNPAQDVTFRAIEKNLFLIQAHCLGDWKRIKEEGSWLFRDCALMLEDFDGSMTTPRVMPSRFQTWIQIHKIPPLYRTEAILRQLASRVGEVVKVELKAISFGNGEFHRARVLLEADTPLMRIVSLSPEGCAKLFMQVVFEKLPKFCDHCGLMGHVVLECGTGEFSDEQLQYGDWMLAPMETWHPETPRVRGGFSREREASGGGRGMGEGRQGDTLVAERLAVVVVGPVCVERDERESGVRRKQETLKASRGKGRLVKRGWKGRGKSSRILRVALSKMVELKRVAIMGRHRRKNS